ncbi:NUDIX hydrolase [Roseivivax sediminis]|uniref:8-oxo-dGTP diphosphatase n=1 Tax=Roseivivax sediminis TaxID=936889 RepID=A0A1I1UF70_9RHOB|nr:NUDIX hydrolase [Roseivivax sediminis]SFD69377.1 8-oxo-dGTP diphosphatase [Roseivivax sediminis]
MTERFGPPPEGGRRYTLRAGAYAVLMRGGEVLVTHQEEPWPEFQLPGGGIDPGESPLQALHREVLEETGWRIAAPRRLGAFRRFTYMPEYDLWAEKLCIIYAARPVLPLGPPSEPGHMAVWMAPELAAGQLGNGGDRAYLARHARLRPYSKSAAETSS